MIKKTTTKRSSSTSELLPIEIAVHLSNLTLVASKRSPSEPNTLAITTREHINIVRRPEHIIEPCSHIKQLIQLKILPSGRLILKPVNNRYDIDKQR